MSKYRRLRLLLVVLFLFLQTTNGTFAGINQQEGTFDPRAVALLETLTPEERVGQLFLVTFNGKDVGSETRIYDLIVNHHIGGVILSAENDNFSQAEQTINDAWTLTNQLQTTEFLGSQEEIINPETEEAFQPSYIPLFIGISQEGDGYPNDQIFNGTTPLPSQMAIGATWDPELSFSVGEVLGMEMAALGINLLFGPSLDVVETPRPEGNTDLGVRTFGGDPFWVGKIGSAYINGVHEGSNNRIAVVGKHFPGLGSSDRFPEDEVATVRKSLEQLKQIELAPFYTVTGEAPSEGETVDALLTSHIRYQGLQGNIRATTRPISFDPQAFDPLMNLPPFATWREDGGVMITDDLGSRAVKRLYDPTEEVFNARLPARDAFLAGNDLLYVGKNFIDSNDPDNYTTILQTLNFFTQKYVEDPTFAQRVDESVLRILSLKYKLYTFFTLNHVLATGIDLSEIGTSEQVTFKVASQGATLIHPPLDEIDSVIPNIPSLSERIVIITDYYQVRQCSECPEQDVIPYNALEQAILDQYGPSSGGQVLPYNIISHTFREIEGLLNGEAGTGQIESNLRRAHWIIFVMLDINPERPTSLTLRRFLFERPDMTRQKRVVTFAANAPYYLDATDISKLDAYYGLFGKVQPFMDVAARLLFKEIPVPRGSLPVSVTGIGYDLISATSPDPDQTITILLDEPEQQTLETTTTPEAIEPREFKIGDQIQIKTGVILDHNGHPVPDHTPVQFVVSTDGEEILLPKVETDDGVARIAYQIEHTGELELQAIIDPARSEILIINVPILETQPVDLTITPTPSVTPSPTETPTQIIPTPTVTPTPTPSNNQTDIGDWSLAILAASLIGWGAYRSGTILGQVRWGMRWGLSAFIGGLLVYTYISIGMPGSSVILNIAGRWGVSIAILIGSGIGWGIAAIFINGKSSNNDHS